jgi:hypothetical protein
VAYAFGKSNGDVLDEWVFNFQVSNPFTARKQETGEDFYFLV